MRSQRPGLVAVVVIHDGDLVVVLAHPQVAVPDLDVAFQSPPGRCQCRRVQAGARCCQRSRTLANKALPLPFCTTAAGAQALLALLLVWKKPARPAPVLAHAQLVGRVSDATCDKPVLGDHAVLRRWYAPPMAGCRWCQRSLPRIGGGVASSDAPVVAGGPDAVLINGRPPTGCPSRPHRRRGPHRRRDQTAPGEHAAAEAGSDASPINASRLTSAKIYRLHGLSPSTEWRWWENRSVKCSCLHILQDCLKSVASGLRKSTLPSRPALAPLACHGCAFVDFRSLW